MTWVKDLVRASWRGVEFDVLNTGDAIERRVVEHEYLYRDGADLDDTGRKARPTQLTAVFFGEGYRDRLISLLKVCDEGKTGPLRHPIFGIWQAKLISARTSHEHARRDYAQVELEFREDGTNTTLPDTQSIAGAQDAMTSAVSDLQDAYDDLGTDSDDVEAAITDATSYTTDVEDTDEDLTARWDQLHKTVREAEGSLDSVAPEDAWPVVQGLRDVLLRAQELKGRLERIKPKVLEQTLPVDAPLVALATKLYGDPDRAADLLRLNKVRQPFLVPPGTVLKVHSA